MDGLGVTLSAEGHYPDAEQLIRQTVDARRRILGMDNPDTSNSTYDLACVLARESRADEALSLLQAAVDHGLTAKTALAIPENADLKSLHRDPRFTALVARARQRITANP
jgi:hypothetical protein